MGLLPSFLLLVGNYVCVPAGVSEVKLRSKLISYYDTACVLPPGPKGPYLSYSIEQSSY